MKDLQEGMELRHYKGGKYEVLGFGTCSETLDNLVIYQNEEGEVWIRPLYMFYEVVLHEGELKARFEQL